MSNGIRIPKKKLITVPTMEYLFEIGLASVIDSIPNIFESNPKE